MHPEYAEYKQPQLTFLALLPWFKRSDLDPLKPGRNTAGPIKRDSPGNGGNVRFTTVPLEPLSDQ